MAFNRPERYVKNKSNENGEVPNDSCTAKKGHSPMSKYNIYLIFSVLVSTCFDYFKSIFMACDTRATNRFRCRCNSVLLHCITVSEQKFCSFLNRSVSFSYDSYHKKGVFLSFSNCSQLCA